MLGLLTMGVALAGTVDPALVEKRMAEIEPLRSQRVAEDPPGIPEDAYAKAAAGEVVTALESVEGHKAKRALGVAVVKAPIGKMWAAVNDEQSKTANTQLGYVEILEGKNCANGRLVLQYLPIRLVTDRWWVVRQTQNPGLEQASEGRVREVQWKSTDQFTATPSAQSWMDKGMSLAFTRGTWFLVDIDGEHTLIEYTTWTDPGGSIPAGLASSFAAGGIRDTIDTMTKLANKGTHCPVQ